MSRMATETCEAPDAVARLLDREGSAIRDLGRRLATMAPPFVVTCGRGSSDHAAMYLKYSLEIATGIPVCSMGPSVASVYGTAPRVKGAVVVTVSQSGRSPDLVAFQAACRAAGALTIALVNVAESPVAAGADILIPLHAGAETSVAATKSFIAAAAAAAALVAAWSGDTARMAAVERLPWALEGSLGADWSEVLAPLATAGSCYTLGRGPGLAMAAEAALKLKEVLGRHAEAFSFAEVMHGPLRLLGPEFPLLAFLPDDAAQAANRAAIARLEVTGARVLVGQGFTGTGEAMLDPIAMMAPFYLGIEVLARRQGLDPDRPTHLSKVTETR